GEAAAPGTVLLHGGFGLAPAGIALIVLVMRALLAQAVDRDVEAHQLRSELDEVI
ncbi:MAG: transporter, partial [Aeromicrobium sp.]|nr:transporter [Aeromicrobium sp.]